MRKHMNIYQQQIFLRFMKEHPDLARGFVKGDKVAQDEQWNILKNELNLAGSPIKDTTCWKKSWLDWKNNVKRKLAHNEKEAQKKNIKLKLDRNKTEVRKTVAVNFNQCVLSNLEEKIALICGLYKTVDKIDNTKSFGVRKKNIQTTFAPPSHPVSSRSSGSSPILTSSDSASPHQTTSNQRERKRTDLIENQISTKRKRCENLEEILSENNNLENISAKIEILTKNKNVEHTVLEKIVNKLNDIDTRLANLENKYDKIIELEIKKLEIISQHNVVIERPDIRTEKTVQLHPSLPTKIELNSAVDHPEDHCHKSLQSAVEENYSDIKVEFYSDSDSDSDVKNLIEISNTEYIYDEDIVVSTGCLEEKFDAN